MKIKRILFILVFLLVNKLSHAQCALSKTVTNGGTITETTETYIYNGRGKLYHALALKVFTLQTSSATKTFLKVKYTTVNNLQKPQFLSIGLTNAKPLTLPLKFIANNKSDNAQQLTKIYQVELNEHIIDQLSMLQASSVGVLSSAKYTLAEITVTDSDMFRQLLVCFKK